MGGKGTLTQAAQRPTTCNKLIGNTTCSQPSPRLIIQIDSVLHVSASERAVALTCLVTLSPKKLEERDAAADHEAGVEHGGRRDHLRPAAREVEERGEARNAGN